MTNDFEQRVVRFRAEMEAERVHNLIGDRHGGARSRIQVPGEPAPTPTPTRWTPTEIAAPEATTPTTPAHRIWPNLR